MKKLNAPNRFLSIQLCCILILSYSSFSVRAIDAPKQLISCNTPECIRSAMENASPGDEIVIASGTYISYEKFTTPDRIAARYYSAANGTSSNQIIIRGEDPDNPPILKGPDDIYDGYAMRIRGDHWVIQDLILEDGSKGLVLDGSSFSEIRNVIVRDIAQEAIHLRDGSSNVLIEGCKIYNVGVNDPGNGEAVYVGSDRKVHPQNVDPGDISFDPKCDNTIIQNCVFGPNVRAEGVDVKEGTSNTIIRNCTFSATGISNLTSANAFIDLKGVYGFVYDNIFNVDGEPNLEAGVDVQDRKTVPDTGYRNAIFNNTFNLGPNSEDIPAVRFQGGDPIETHAWDNTRVPDTPEPIAYYSDEITNSCPDWNIEPCNTLTISEINKDEIFNYYPNPVDNILHIRYQKEQISEITIKTIEGRNISKLYNVVNMQEIDVSNLVSGMYVIQLKTQQEILSGIFVKE